MKLPCELFGFNGNQLTKEARDVVFKSSALWKNGFEQVPSPSAKSNKMQKAFAEWMSQKEIDTIEDFK